MIRALFLSLCVVGFLLPVCAQAENQRVLLLHGDAHYFPYTYLDDTGSPAGFLVDLIEAIQAETGQQFEIKLRSWTDVPDALRSGDIDGILGMFRTADREQEFDFSLPTIVATHSAFVRIDSPDQNIEDLRGKSIIVQEHDVMDEYLQTTRLAGEIIRVGNQGMAIRLLSQGEYDAVLALRILAWHEIRTNHIDNLRELEFTLMPLDYCISVAKEDVETLNIINEGLNAIRLSGTYDRIRENWFTMFHRQQTVWPYWNYFLWIMGGIVLIVILFIGWTMSLRHQVNVKTTALQKELEAREKLTTHMQQRERFIDAVLQTTPDYVAVYDLDVKQVIYINKIPDEVQKWNLTNIADLTQSAIQRFIHPEDIERIHTHWLHLLKAQDRQVLSIEYRIMKKDEEACAWFYSRDIVFLRHPSGRVKQCLSIVHDITNRKWADEERHRLEQHMQQVQKLESLGVLAGGIAHDFNNILLAILGNADLALSDLSPVSPAQVYLSEIEKASRRAADLCRQMLAYSGKGKFVISAINLNDVIEDMTQMLQVSITKKAVLRLQLTRDVAVIEGDVTQIRQVVMNLVINASDAIADKSGVISVSTGVMECDRSYLSDVFLDEGLPEGKFVFLEVADTGCGMNAETLSNIFDPFFTTKFTGRGLGLAAVMGIVRGHRGALKVYSEEGQGSTFKILFPAHFTGSVSAPNENDKTKQQHLGTGTVLLADDEEVILHLAKRMLERIGYNVITAEDGREAVSLYKEHQNAIDCVVLDLTMPHMDGAEAYREMRRINPGVRCVMSSGYNQQEVSQRFVGKGLCGFIQKPYTLQELGDVMRIALSKEM